MLNLPGYTVREELYRSARTLVLRASHGADSVVLKTPSSAAPDPEQSTEIRTEYQVGARIDHPGVLRHLDLLWDGHRPALVVEDFGGRSLEQVLQGPLVLDLFLELAIQLVRGLDALHRRGVIHKDITLANMIINPARRVIKLADLGLASVLAQEGAGGQAAVGTLAYMSPEQTGRLNRAVDYRTDFYSLGVAFYRMLTGEMPFHTDDPVSLVHAHIARLPTPPVERNRDVPAMLSALVMKLLAKSADERYQSSAGLLHDLERCRALARQGRLEQGFELATKDRPLRFQVPDRIYGRRRELDRLSEALTRTVEGSRLFVTLSGPSGCGKSALSSALERQTYEQGGWFVGARCDPLQRHSPNAAIVSLLRGLCRLVLTESEQRLRQWRQALGTVLGREASLVTDAVPELSTLLGEQPAAGVAAPLATSPDSERLFQHQVRAMVQVACLQRYPLVLFLDDLHWADGASLRLLESVLGDASTHHLLVLGAFREEEVASTDPLALMLRSQARQPAGHQALRLGPLQTGHLAALVADTLRCPVAQVEPLAQLIRTKSLGNPLYAREFFRSLHEGGLIRLDEQQRWQWEMSQLESHPAPDDVADLLLGAIESLPPATRRLLQLAACIGARFDLQTLHTLFGGPTNEMLQQLRQAVDAGVLLPVCVGFNTVLKWSEVSHEAALPLLARSRCEFLHDRVQSACYAQLSPEQRARAHHRLARLWARRIAGGEHSSKLLFETATHYAAAASRLSAEQRLEAARLHLEAGVRAQQSAGRRAARRFLAAGRDLLPADAWDCCQPLAFALRLELLRTMVMDPAHAAEGLSLGRSLLARASGTVQRLDATCLHVMQLSTRGGQPEQALELGFRALREVGIDIRPDQGSEVVQQHYQQLRRRLEGNGLESLLELPALTDAEKSAAMRLLEHLFFFPVTMRRRDLAPLVALEAVRLSLEHGNGPGSEAAYVVWGIVVAHELGDLQTGHRLGKLGVTVSDRIGAHRTITRALALVTDWPMIPAERMRQRLRGIFRLGLETGEHVASALTASTRAMLGLVCGEPLEELERECRPLEQFVQREMGSAIGVREVQLSMRAIANLRGTSGRDTRLFDSDEEERAALECAQRRNPEAVHWHHLLRARLLLLHDRPLEALEQARLAVDRADRRTGHYGAYEALFVLGLAAAMSVELSPDQRREELVQRLGRAQRELQRWCDAGAEHSFGFMNRLLQAEMARLAHEPQRAARLYEEAIAEAARSGRVNNEALANERAAALHQAQGLEKVARSYLADAHYCYRKWGAMARVRLLEQRYPDLERAGGDEAAAPCSSSGSRPGLLDLAAVAKASQAISGEVELPSLLRKLLAIAVENTGAQRGVLVLQRGAELTVAAAVAGEGEVELGATPLAQAQQVSGGIVRYVARTRAPVVLADAVRQGQFRTDPYVSQHRPRSVLALPLVNQGTLVGVLYLENNLAGGTFDDSRLEVAWLLCAQAAISIDNARLYAELRQSNAQLEEYSRSLEQKVEARTHDLEQKNSELNRSLQRQREMQDQLLLNEKLASLGNLVAGVAHELNTPLGAIASSVDTARRCLQRLHIERDGVPVPGEQGSAPALRAQGLLTDSLQVVADAAQRADQVVATLRSFARLDEAQRKPADLHQGLESTLALVRHRLPAGVTLERDYGELPEVLCYPEQLNQVFMSLMSNAIDALDASPAPPGGHRIVVRTRLARQAAEIQVSDTGHGVPDELRRRIFEPGFTTKGVGVGTGLGLSISYSIAQAHGGSLVLDSPTGGGSRFTLSLPLAAP